MPNYKLILSLHEQGVSQRQISKLAHSSRDIIRRITSAAAEYNITADQLEGKSDEEIEKLLKLSFSNSNDSSRIYAMPDYAYYSKELKKPGVTITLLWEEYVQECRSNGKIPYGKTQFGKYFREYVMNIPLIEGHPSAHQGHSSAVNRATLKREKIHWSSCWFQWIFLSSPS